MIRIAVYIDYQNAYMLARSAFGDPPNDRFTFGQVHPGGLGELLTRRGQAADRRHLALVGVDRGEPEARLDPRGKAVFKRQVRRWGRHVRHRAAYDALPLSNHRTETIMRSRCDSHRSCPARESR